MINSISSVSSLSPLKYTTYCSTPQPKEEHQKVKIEANSLDALAAYNFPLIKPTDMDLKRVNKMQIPKNIEDIKGERIYNSKGELVEILNEDNNNKTQYKIRDNKVFYIYNKDKNTNVIKTQSNSKNDTWSSVSIKLPNGKIYGTNYDNATGKPLSLSQSSKNGDDISYNFDQENNEYYIEQHFKRNSENVTRTITLDSKQNYIDAFELSKGLTSTTKDLMFNKGQPYLLKETKSYTIPNNTIDLKNINTKEIKPASKINVDEIDFNTISGKRTYYSNKQLETLTTTDGTTYEFSPSGTLRSLKNNKHTVYFNSQEDSTFQDIDLKGQRIEEILPDSTKKITQYYEDGTIGVFINNTNAQYSSDGKLKAYFSDNLNFELDQNGNYTYIDN